jgi:3-phenylpropionate/trans-cinnamate dioxygenase alpha subunit
MRSGIDAAWIDELVSVERGEIDRRIFSDEEIFERELELIFARAWHFLCHETQIPKAGDFVETPIGRDSVLTVRQKDGSIRAMLNTCMHRGNAVCRAEEGNTKAFMCTYHGWSYDLAGNLIGIPDADRLYKGTIDKSQHGLRQAAQIGNYHGFVFATLDATAPPLEEYLGSTGRLGIDLAASREIEVIPGVQKFVIDCNWKLAVDNLFDWYHPQVTHMSAAASGIFPQSDVIADQGGATTTAGNRLDIPASLATSDELAFVGEFGHAIAGPSIDGLPPNTPVDHSWRQRPPASEWLGPDGGRSFGHPNIFPNSWITQGPALSLRIPISPTKTEVWWINFVEKNATPEERAFKVMGATHFFGPAGLLEQDDGENWWQSTATSRGVAMRGIRHLLRMDHGTGKVIKENGLARIEGQPSEHGQLWTYHCWAQWMKGVGWDELRSSTEPPDLL